MKKLTTTLTKIMLLTILSALFNHAVADDIDIYGVSADNTTQCASSILSTVTPYSGLAAGDNSLLYPLFLPERPFTRWLGNLKKYQLARGTGNDTELTIRDKELKKAIDENGKIKSDSRSFWSSNDGSDISLGGVAANQPNDLTGHVYYDISPSSSSPQNPIQLPKTSSNNSLISGSDLEDNNLTNATIDKIIDWAYGKDVDDINSNNNTTESRKQIYDIIHSTPVVVNYSNNRQRAYFGTNDGFLHAVDLSTGVEKYRLISKKLLPNLLTYYNNSVISNAALNGYHHVYGLDGTPMTWLKDTNNNGILDASADRMYFITGARRGEHTYTAGQNPATEKSHYYVIDITDPDQPSNLVTLPSDTSTSYDELGETWSTPVKTRISYNGGVKDVLIFGGGYGIGFDYGLDFKTDWDTAPWSSSDNSNQKHRGNAIFMVDADDFSLIWKASKTSSTSANFTDGNMLFPIPGDINVIDTNSDGLADQFYASDLGGQIWRFDIDTSTTTTANITGGRIAQLGDREGNSENLPNTRVFFNTPDVALAIDDSGTRFLALTIGSGNTELPLSTVVNNRFYVITTPLNKPSSYPTAVTDSNLTDLTSSATTTANKLTATSKGWKINLANAGEKTSGKSVTFNNNVYFTTYTPSTVAGSQCAVVQGTSRIYALNLYTSNAIYDLNHNDSVELRTDRSRALQNTSLAGVSLHLRKDSNNSILGIPLVGGEVIAESLSDNALSQDWFPSYWYQRY